MKKMIKIAFVAAFVAIAGYGVYTNQKSETLSDLTLANACVPESRYKNLGEFISYHIYRNSRKHTLFQFKLLSLPRPPFLVGYGTGGTRCTNKT